MCVETAEGARGAESSLKMKTRDAGIQAQCTGTALGKEATMHERYDRLLKKKMRAHPLSRCSLWKLWAYAEGRARPESTRTARDARSSRSRHFWCCRSRLSHVLHSVRTVDDAVVIGEGGESVEEYDSGTGGRWEEIEEMRVRDKVVAVSSLLP